MRSVDARPVLLPAKAITSPRETVEVQPYLVICPSDIVTLVNTLFPERRPGSSSLEKDIQRKGLRSSASSISGMSGISLPVQMKPPSRGGLEAASMISNSGSSMTSDTTSREPLLDSSSQLAESNNSATTFVDPQQEKRSVLVEEYGHKLRLAVNEMTRILGSDVVSGSCHPCAERWAVLYVSADGKELMTRMAKDWVDEDEDEDDSLDSDSDDGVTEKSSLDIEYHQLKESII